MLMPLLLYLREHTASRMLKNLMLASVAFVTGFAGYLAVLSLAAPVTPDDYQHAQTPAISTPDDWNIGKRI